MRELPPLPRGTRVVPFANGVEETSFVGWSTLSLASAYGLGRCLGCQDVPCTRWGTTAYPLCEIRGLGVLFFCCFTGLHQLHPKIHSGRVCCTLALVGLDDARGAIETRQRTARVVMATQASEMMQSDPRHAHTHTHIAALSFARWLCDGGATQCTRREIIGFVEK